jgi:hypothetical protein
MADVDREAIARRHGLPEGYGACLTGETREACEAIAAAVAALRPSEPPVNVGEMAALKSSEAKARRNRALLGFPEEEEEEEEEEE